jgi:tetratricopeptide (TPR) repeat protein
MTTTPDPMNLMPHPTEETLAAFVDDRLDRATRHTVIEHIADCAECNDIVMTATEFKAGEEPDAPPAWRFTPRVVYTAAISLAAAAMVVLVFGPMVRERLDERKSLEDLTKVAELLDHRRTEGRLTLDLPYKTYEPVKRGGGERGSFERVFDKTVKGDKDDHPSQALDRRAVSELLLRENDAAIRDLEAALRQDSAAGGPGIDAVIQHSTRARLLVDLAAAYLARDDDDKGDQENALRAAERSWTLDQTPEAAWNRALALENLEKNAEAADAWRAYLKLDSSSPWAQEATTHLENLSPQDSSPAATAT